MVLVDGIEPPKPEGTWVTARFPYPTGVTRIGCIICQGSNWSTAQLAGGTVARPEGFEPSLAGLEAAVLPLHHVRKIRVPRPQTVVKSVVS